MFWVVDNFLMKKGRTKAKLEEREGGDESRGSTKVRYRRALSHDDSESEVSSSSTEPGIAHIWALQPWHILPSK